MWLGKVWRRLRFLLRRKSFDAELEEEMRLHRELRAEWLRAHGRAEPAEACSAARRQFGNPASLEEVSREMWGVRWFEDFCQDLRLAGRQLRKSSGSALVAVITLALGIGANTAIFTLIDALLLKSLLVRDPAGLVVLGYG